MCILPDESGDVGLLASGCFGRRGEEFVECFGKGIRPAHPIHEGAHVVGYGKAVLPCIGLCKVEVDLVGIKGFLPRGVGFTPEEPACGVKQVFPVLSALHECFVHRVVALHFGHLGDAPIVVGVFKGFGNTFALFISRYIPIFAVVVYAPFGLFGRGDHGFQGQLAIVPADALSPGIGDDGHAVVTNHAVGFVASQLPHRQQTRLFVLVQKRLNKIVHTGWFEQRVERFAGSIGIPE